MVKEKNLVIFIFYCNCERFKKYRGENFLLNLFNEDIFYLKIFFKIKENKVV